MRKKKRARETKDSCRFMKYIRAIRSFSSVLMKVQEGLLLFGVDRPS